MSHHDEQPEQRKDHYAAVRDQMSEPPTHWRSLEHKSRDASVMEVLDVEFPNAHTEPGGFNRREAMKLAGASIALGSLAGCIRRPEEELLPFVKQPEAVIPGVRRLYATSTMRSTGALGLLVEAHEGRPTKIEGNPNHPASLGSTDLWAQTEVLKLYDPDRARLPLSGGKPSTWEAWDGFAQDHFGKLQAAQGKGLAILAEDDGGPTFERLLKGLTAKLPEAKVYRWDPLAHDHAQAGADLAFGPGARARYDLEKADVLFALDSNFLAEGPEAVRHARQFGKRRTLLKREDAARMHRLYAAEGVFSATGASADHRVRVASGQAVDLLKAVAKELANHQVDLGELAGAIEAAPPPGTEKFVAALAKDLAAHRGQALILVGNRQPPAVHALAYALNVALGAGASGAMTVAKEGVAGPRAPHAEQLAALAKALSDGQVQTLVVFDANPLHTAPGALKFGEALAKAQAVVHVGVLPEETGLKATWHLPASHFLEAWGDARAWDGTASIVQPIILPLYGTRAPISVLAQLQGAAERNDKKLVEETWRGQGAPLADLKAWRRALHDGVIANSALLFGQGEVQRPQVAAAVGPLKGAAPTKDALEFTLLHGNLLDGRISNVTWVQELPDSMSKLSWDNAVLVSPALARELGIASAVVRNKYLADVVELTVDGRKITAPSFVLPGLAPYTVAMVAGYGRAAGEVAKGVGVDGRPLLAGSTVVQGVKLQKTGGTQDLCSTQDHFSVPANPYKELTFAQASGAQGKDRELGLGERPLYRQGTADAFAKEGGTFARAGEPPASLVQLGTPKSRPSRLVQLHSEVTYEGQQWGMTIDLTSCIGCNVCAVACVAENNIPTVGREQVLLGRELHWIRVDRYFTGDVDDPKAAQQPLPCMHCENAPCEPVCPVAATTHDEEGLNSMAYNRCIGTRYCANNCPFKVRRFNYLDFTVTGDVSRERVGVDQQFNTMKWDERWKVMKLQRNPDVTVRYRGVMEKCTYCTQRIEEAKVLAKRAGKDRKALPDGAVTPACAQACPTQAITFGNINDPNSQVAKLKSSERNYEMLQELNIRPRTTFLARVRNENQELA